MIGNTATDLMEMVNTLTYSFIKIIKRFDGKTADLRESVDKQAKRMGISDEKLIGTKSR